MRIFVVGGAGYIGSVCAELLLDEGHEVAIFDNLTEGHGRAVDSRANFIQGELADRAHIQAALSSARPDAVMHFAASVEVLSQQYLQRVEPARCHDRNARSANRFFLDLRDFWIARAVANRGNDARASD